MYGARGPPMYLCLNLRQIKPRPGCPTLNTVYSEQIDEGKCTVLDCTAKNLFPDWQYVEVSLPELTKIIRLTDPLLKNPRLHPSSCLRIYVRYVYDVNVPLKSISRIFFYISFLLVSWRSITKKAGSGSTPKCHGSGTLLMAIVFVSDLKVPSCAVSASSWRLLQDPRPTASMLTPASGSPATIRGCEGSIHQQNFRILAFFPFSRWKIT